MQKKTLAISVILFLSVNFSGCLSSDIPIILIVGKWNQIDSDITMIFQDNGRLHIISNSTIKSVNYELLEDKTIKVYLDDNTEYWEHVFLDDNTLKLRLMDNSSWEIFERVE
jgi:hypothetical protein